MTQVALTKRVLKPTREEIHQQVRDTIGLLGGIEKFVKKGEKVQIKPNIAGSYKAETGTLTNPFVVEAIVNLCEEAGAGEIVVGEGSAVGQDTFLAMEESGWMFLKEQGIRLLDLNKEEMIKVNVPDGIVFKELYISKPILDADVLINVPVLKTHLATVMTCCMKNLKGVLSYTGKKAMHFYGLEEGIVDLNSIVKARLSVVDAILCQEGLGPVAGTPLPLGIMMAGTDAVALDTVGAKIMGIESQEVNQLNLAGERGLGINDLEKIHILGDELEGCIHPFKLPVINAEFPQIDIDNVSACSGCNKPLMLSLKQMEAAGELELLKEKHKKIQITLGKQGSLALEGLNICFGNCQKPNKETCHLFVEGCSPAGWYFRDLIRQKYLGLEPLVDPGPIIYPE